MATPSAQPISFLALVARWGRYIIACSSKKGQKEKKYKERSDQIRSGGH
jgi:hypothetical protein